MKTIVVATDFSSAALNAAKYATNMALTIHANILLLHVIEIQMVYSDVPIIINDKETMKEAEKNMVALKNELIKKTGGKIAIESEIKTGTFFQELKMTCEQVHPYVVIIGNQGKSALERVFIGEHAVYTMKHLKWPLISVPATSNFLSIQKIGIACDFNHVVETIPLDEIKSLVREYKAELHIFNIGKNEVFDPELVFESGLLQELLLELKPIYHFITNKDIDLSILQLVEEHRIDLLIVIPKRHSLIDRLIHHSHTKEMVLHSHVPVLSLHQ